ALFGGRNGNDPRVIKTLISEFEYPRLGPGMMWEAFQKQIEEAGGRVELGARVTKILHDDTRVTGIHVERGGSSVEQPASHLLSTIPLRHLIRALSPAAPP